MKYEVRIIMHLILKRWTHESYILISKLVLYAFLQGGSKHMNGIVCQFSNYELIPFKNKGYLSVNSPSLILLQDDETIVNLKIK